ncbi:UNVERIFIED_CONTAM: hypothetical protein H355_002219 [Colinus virginianus]|nr:hypothetical protein H355_002219 [Colinus virginianus]
MQRLIKVDGKVRTDTCYPTGSMDVISVEKTQEHFRLLLDTKGRFIPHPIRAEEAAYKLCRIKRVLVGSKGVPAAITHDGRTIRFPHPAIKTHDSVRLDLESGKKQVCYLSPYLCAFFICNGDKRATPDDEYTNLYCFPFVRNGYEIQYPADERRLRKPKNFSSGNSLWLPSVPQT